MADLVRDGDGAFIRDLLLDSVRVANEFVLLKIHTGEIAGNPAHGIARTFTYLVKKSKVVISGLSPQDIMYSGGIYQVGDMQLQLFEELKQEDQGQPGDRLIYRGHEYRIVGKVQTNTIAESDHVFSYAVRKVGKVG